MSTDDLTNKHLLPEFVILVPFVLMAWRGEVAPTDRGLYAPTPAPPCDCDHDDFDCDDFSTHAEAQACLDYCWTQAGCDIHHPDTDGDRIPCEATMAVPRARVEHGGSAESHGSCPWPSGTERRDDRRPAGQRALSDSSGICSPP
jgi:hypothetical protein